MITRKLIDLNIDNIVNHEVICEWVSSPKIVPGKITKRYEFVFENYTVAYQNGRVEYIMETDTMKDIAESVHIKS